MAECNLPVEHPGTLVGRKFVHFRETGSIQDVVQQLKCLRKEIEKAGITSRLFSIQAEAQGQADGVMFMEAQKLQN